MVGPAVLPFVSEVSTCRAGVVVIAPAIFAFVAQMITRAAYPGIGGGCQHNDERKDRDNNRSNGLEHRGSLLGVLQSYPSLTEGIRELKN